MLNIRLLEISSTFSIYLPLAILLSLIFFFQCLIVISNKFNIIEFSNLISYTQWFLYSNKKIVAIGQLLFNECYILFLGATLLLFIAMIGVILLTLKKEKNLKENSNNNKNLKIINWRTKN